MAPTDSSLIEIAEPVSGGMRRLLAGRLVDAFTSPGGFFPLPSVRYVLPPDWAGTDMRDGEWPEVATLPHEPVEFDGRSVPAYDLRQIDPERWVWEEARRG